jgi:hypothetical protein
MADPFRPWHFVGGIPSAAFRPWHFVGGIPSAAIRRRK